MSDSIPVYFTPYVERDTAGSVEPAKPATQRRVLLGSCSPVLACDLLGGPPGCEVEVKDGKSLELVQKITKDEQDRIYYEREQKLSKLLRK